jgi:zinc transport system permease protein
MTDEFVLRALAGGLGAALAAGPVGCFIVWRRMAYFGDSLAHSALLGIGIGVLLGTEATVGILIGCVVLALAMTLLQEQRWLAGDTALGILAHASLALGLVVLSFLEHLRLDLLGYLFGDILAVTWSDVAWIWGGAAVALAGLAWIWRPLLAVTVHEDLARAEGVPGPRVRFAFTLLIAVVIAVAMKLVGVILITSLLIVPAATARRFARTPEAMAALAAAAGGLAVIAGLGGSLAWDTPAGPSIVVAAAGGFAAALALGGAWQAARTGE